MLVDCGLPQGEADNGDTWQPFIYNPHEVDYLLVTHAHLDHIGKIAFLINQGFKGKIFSTKATREIARPALEDAFHLLSMESVRNNEKTPYTIEDVEIAFSLWHTVEYGEVVRLGDDLSAKFFNASHVLGSAMIQISSRGKKLLMTGDMGNNSLLLKDADIPSDSDYVCMECVYGNRRHEGMETRSMELEQTILDNIQRKGTLVIPAFSIERTQEVLSEINDLVESRKMPVIPVYLDSPLSIEITHIFHHYKHLLKGSVQDKISRGDDVFSFPGLHMSHTRDESMEINHIPGPKIVIAGSGMVQGGRVMHHVKRYLEDPNNTIMMVGYQARGTTGNKLLREDRKTVTIGEAVLDINARVMNLGGYSAHRDVDALCEFVAKVKDNCKQLNLILGDEESLLGFKEIVKEKFNIDAYIPSRGEVLEF
jgi:metallo-beta-lactamase family protein